MRDFLFWAHVAVLASVALFVFVLAIVNVFAKPDNQDRKILIGTVFMGCLLFFYFLCDVANRMGII